MDKNFLDDIFAKTKKVTITQRLGPALVKTGFAATGGLIAGRVDSLATESWPKSAVAGPVLIGLISVGLRLMADGDSGLEQAANELAAGMAGWIGDDAWYLIRNFLGLGFKKWVANTDYLKGAQIKYEGKLYRASREVKGGLSTPDKDPSWNLIEGAAQGFRAHELSDIRAFAQALADDTERWQASSIDVLEKIGPLIEETTGYTFEDSQKAKLVGHMTDILQQSVREL